MNPCEITASITAIANVLAKSLSNKELAYWGVILAQLGETMGTLAALGEFNEGDEANSETAAGEEGAEPRNAAITSQLL